MFSIQSWIISESVAYFFVGSLESLKESLLSQVILDVLPCNHFFQDTAVIKDLSLSFGKRQAVRFQMMS